MPTTSVLVAFVLASLAIIVIPGPSVVYVMARGVAQRQAPVFAVARASTSSGVSSICEPSAR